MLAAGAQLTGKRIGAGQLWMGRPAKYLRDLEPEAIAANQAGVQAYVVNGRLHAKALGLTP
jgi:carbonic anhydrase/acetyltransferase-like protein (isoleucine patch superfamily)